VSVFVWGVFDDEAGAQRAVDEVIEARFPPEEISVMVRGAHGEIERRPVAHKTLAPLGAAIGAAIGAAGGAGFVAIATSGAPADFVRAALIGALVGAVLGVRAGIYWWRKEADVPSAAFDRGEVLIGVTVPEERAAEAKQSVERAGAARIGVSDTPPPR
jgi:hypothetical protein